MHLFDAFGIELEYMIVDRESLAVKPIADRVLVDESGAVTSDIDRGPISWSNELTHHVIELKTNGPALSLTPLAGQFEHEIREINERLADEDARLLPTAMHPWMDPKTEMQLWPHDYHVVYETFDRIFDCRGHGWANLQSMHINLPFANDNEFGRLHAAIRLILPLLPALAASSPIVEGQRSGQMDSRLDVYRKNARGVASVSGRVIPEPVFDEASYRREIFDRMFADIAQYDPDGVLQDEFLNARGAIARFSRGAIEIRVIDVQECPQADLAIAALTVAVLKLLIAEKWTSFAEQSSLSIDQLEPAFLATIQQADQAVISDHDYLRQFGIDAAHPTAKEVWWRLYEACIEREPDLEEAHGHALGVLLNEGCLSRRILHSLDSSVTKPTMHQVYHRLANCLESGEMFRVG